MAKDLSLYTLQQPLPLDSALSEQRDQYQDCTPCRLMGTSYFICSLKPID